MRHKITLSKEVTYTDMGEECTSYEDCGTVTVESDYAGAEALGWAMHQHSQQGAFHMCVEEVEDNE